MGLPALQFKCLRHGGENASVWLTVELKRRWQMLHDMMGFFFCGATPKVWLITAFCTGSIWKMKHTGINTSLFFPAILSCRENSFCVLCRATFRNVSGVLLRWNWGRGWAVRSHWPWWAGSAPAGDEPATERVDPGVAGNRGAGGPGSGSARLKGGVITF